MMAISSDRPEYVFEISWEVCNKIGGIHTVLETLAPTLSSVFSERVIFVGPDLGTSEFKEDKNILKDWAAVLKRNGLKVRTGRWNISSSPAAILVNPWQLSGEKDSIYADMWNSFGVDSLHAYGDYDESSMWACACGRMIAVLKRECMPADGNIILQAHEWQSAMALLAAKKANVPGIATVFTTHATTVGRSICDNNKCLYKYFSSYPGNVMAGELHVESKHSSEKAAAVNADCFTTVSKLTDAECRQFLGKSADVILPNGFNIAEIPRKDKKRRIRSSMRKRVISVAECLLGRKLASDTLIVSTSGRYDFRPKGYDVFLEAMYRLSNCNGLKREVLALMEVPLWTKGPREDLKERMNRGKDDAASIVGNLPNPYTTHSIVNLDTDRLSSMLRGLGLDSSTLKTKVHVVLIPTYLNGRDGIFNCDYYDMLLASDLTVYPSYYEPWGYTPLESVAFGIPTVTTDLAGFGLWVNSFVGGKASLQDCGIEVMTRNDDNYFEAAERIRDIVLDFSGFDSGKVAALSSKAEKIACKADWKNFAKYYLEAFAFAINKNKEDHNNKLYL